MIYVYENIFQRFNLIISSYIARGITSVRMEMTFGCKS